MHFLLQLPFRTSEERKRGNPIGNVEVAVDAYFAAVGGPPQTELESKAEKGPHLEGIGEAML